MLVGAGRILEDVFQTGSCEDPVDEIEDVAEPLDDSVDEEIEDVAEPLDDPEDEEIEDFAEPLDDSMDEEIKSVDEELRQCLHTNNFAYNNFIPIFFHAILLYYTTVLLFQFKLHWKM